MKIERFFFGKKDVVLFFCSVVIFAVLFILIYEPIQATGVSGDMVGSWHEETYLSFLVVIGFMMLGVSRTYMYFYTKNRPITFWGYLGWVAAELIVISLVLSVLSYQIRPKGDVSYLFLAFRVFADVVTILAIPYIVATLLVILGRQRRQIEYLTELNELHRASEDTAPSSDSEGAISFMDRGGRFSFSTRKSNVLYVESADNYCNIHYINDGRLDFYILHNSMKNVNSAYAEQGFMRCHRCYMVNSQRIKAAKKTKDGVVLELEGAEKVIPVSKTYLSDVMAYLSAK